MSIDLRLTHNDTLEVGETIVCIGDRGMELTLTNGRRYKAVQGLEKGIFPDRPFVTVINDFGKTESYHAHRFRKLTARDLAHDLTF